MRLGQREVIRSAAVDTVVGLYPRELTRYRALLRLSDAAGRSRGFARSRPGINNGSTTSDSESNDRA